MNIVFASAETSPFAKTGGLGEVAGALPKALAKLGEQPQVITPFHRAAAQWFDRAGHPIEPLAEIDVRWAGWATRVHLLRSHLPSSDVPVIFVAHPAFDRPQLYAAFGGDDDLERYTLFCRSVIAACEFLGEPVDLLHTHDWHTAALNLYLQSGLREHPLFRATGSVFTIHNLHYQGRYGGDRFPWLGVSGALWPSLEFHGDICMIKGGIVHADRVTTVSPSYAREIQTPEGGAGLDGLMRHLSHKLTGILNGIDADEWNPERDTLIAAPYGPGSMRGKTSCKIAIRKEAELSAKGSRPLIGIVSRLADQKGFDIFLPAVDALVELGFEIVGIGSGEPYYEESFRMFEQRHRERMRFWVGFDPPLSHRIIAGADLVVVPSRYEPCGLIQMQALRYGTLPLVRRVGGLADTVLAWDERNPKEATGFAFDAPDPHELFHAASVAHSVWNQRPLWRRLRSNGMAVDFSWDASARAYREIYREAAAAHRE
ncbi:MAG TPA: glycogen/starch synthase [Thermoanaerobaculia bacterium]|nr:glycogen/starch synthase [Thermoanaerobaculia bacterium]